MFNNDILTPFDTPLVNAEWRVEREPALNFPKYSRCYFRDSCHSCIVQYHHIHHLNHRVPFYRLPEVYRDVPELRQARTTSLHPFEILRCLRLKVWCVETQRMVGVRGL